MTIDRHRQLWQKLGGLGLDGFITRNPENRRYLSGFTGSEGWLIVFQDKIHLCVDSRYTEQAQLQAADCEIEKLDPKWEDTIGRLIPPDCKRLGFEAQHLNYGQWDKLAKELPSVRMIPTAGLVESLRTQKDEDELALIRQAIELADQGADLLRSLLVIGRTESQVAIDLEFSLRCQGADGAAFPFIVASGKRGSLPHGVAGGKKLEAGDLVTVDFGAIYKGYHSDLTRTFSLGPPTAKQKEIYQIVLEAQAKAIDCAGPGVLCSEVDRAARSIIADAGYASYFGHATGHGVGLSIHEEPRLSPQADDARLLPGMVVTVEPGIYLPGWGGVRTEDVILITDQGAEVLSKAPKETFVL